MEQCRSFKSCPYKKKEKKTLWNIFFLIFLFILMGKPLVFCHIKVDFPASVAMLIAKPGRSSIKSLGLCVFLSEKTIKIAFVSHYSHNIIIFAFLHYLFSSSEWRPLTQLCRQQGWDSLPPAGTLGIRGFLGKLTPPKLPTPSAWATARRHPAPGAGLPS